MYASFQVVLNMSNFLQSYKIPLKSERMPYYQSQSIDIFDHPVVEKVSFEVFLMHVCMNAAMLPSYSAGDPCIFSVALMDFFLIMQTSNNM